MFRIVVATVTLCVLPADCVVAQDVARPSNPVDGPGDPPLLPGTFADPPTLNDLPIAESPTRGHVDLLAQAAPIVSGEVIDLPENRLTAMPELVIDNGGMLGAVTSVAINPNATLVAAAGDKLVRIIDVKTGEVLSTLRGDRLRTDFGNTNGVVFSPDGRFLLVAVHDEGDHGSIRIYRTDNWSEIHGLLPGMSAACSHVAFSRDGRYLATSDNNGNIFLWDWPRQSVLKKIPVRNPDAPIIDALQFADRTPHLLTIEADGPHIYRVPDGVEMSANDPMPVDLLTWVQAVAQDRIKWPFPMAQPPRTYCWKLEQKQWMAAGLGTQNGGSKPWVTYYGPVGNQMSFTPKSVYQGHLWEITAATFSDDGSLAVSADKFGEVHLWNAATGQLRHKLVGEGRSIYDAAFTNDVNRIVFSTEPDLANWGINRYGQPDQMLDLKQRVLQKRPDGLAKIDESTSLANAAVRFLPPKPGQESYNIEYRQASTQSRYRVPTGRVPSCLTVLPDRRLKTDKPVLWSDNLGFFAMWDANSEELRRVFRGHESMVTSISPSADQRIVVTGSTDRTIRIWSLTGDRPTGIFDFQYENATVIKVPAGTDSAAAGVLPGDQLVSVDGMTLSRLYEEMLYGRLDYVPGRQVTVTLSRNGRTFEYLMKLKPGFDYVQPILSVFIGDNHQWIIWAPSGHYDCSPGADRLIGWHVNQGPERAAKFYRVQQFRKQLHRPDIINQILEGGRAPDQQPTTPAADQIPKLQRRITFQEHQPPTVTIESPRSGTQPDDPRVTIDALAVCHNQKPIVKVTLLHNGTPAKVFRPRNPSDALRMQVSHRLRLFPGRNEISLIAENSSASSSSEDCSIVLNTPAAKQKLRVWALAFGISDYANSGDEIERLKFAADDAKAFTQAVKAHTDGQLYSAVEVKLLTNQEASRANMLDGLQWLVDNVKAGDAVMLFCSSHGYLDDRQNFYLATHEVDPERLRSTAVSWREVIGILHEELPACRRLVFLDTCHSEGIGTGNSGGPLHDLAAPELGTTFYASCTLQQKSFERDEWQHGAFTKAILDVLKDQNADVSPSTGDGLVNTVELAIGVTNKVSAMTGDRQNPVVFSPQRMSQVNVLEFDH